MSTVLSCSSTKTSPDDWTPVVLNHSCAPIDPNQVLIIDEFPADPFTRIGCFESTHKQLIDLTPGNPIFVYFKQEAAAMGGNTVVIRSPKIQYKNGWGAGSRVDVIYVREEIGTHGGEELGSSSNTVPMDDEFSRIF